MSRPFVDPPHPRAPSQEEWDRLSEAERRAVVAALPASVPAELHPPEGDRHSTAKDRVASALKEFFRRVGRPIYVSKELATYYPNEPVFCPDILAVEGAGLHPRETWVVSDEGRGLSFVLEVHVSGDRRKDFERNVQRYARLGIPEYFAFDRGRMKLSGWRLPESGARVYQPIVPQAGKYASRVLGLDLALEDERVRFYFGTAPLAEAEELVHRLERRVDEVSDRAQTEAERARAEAERARAEAERERAEAERERARAKALESELAEARAEIARLRGR